MTPTELQALLDREGVPVEARAALYMHAGCWFCKIHTHTIPSDIAELAHIGAMVPYAAEHGYVPSPGDGGGWAMRRGLWLETPFFPTLVEALALACGTIAKENGATP